MSFVWAKTSVNCAVGTPARSQIIEVDSDNCQFQTMAHRSGFQCLQQGRNLQQDYKQLLSSSYTESFQWLYLYLIGLVRSVGPKSRRKTMRVFEGLISNMNSRISVQTSTYLSLYLLCLPYGICTDLWTYRQTDLWIHTQRGMERVTQRDKYTHQETHKLKASRHTDAHISKTLQTGEYPNSGPDIWWSTE